MSSLLFVRKVAGAVSQTAVFRAPREACSQGRVFVSYALRFKLELGLELEDA